MKETLAVKRKLAPEVSSNMAEVEKIPPFSKAALMPDYNDFEDKDSSFEVKILEIISPMLKPKGKDFS
jgi:hypothetical protein